jgi:uncharacterized protein (TIGR01244 family)
LRRLAALLLLLSCASTPDEDAPLAGQPVERSPLPGFEAIVSVGPRVLLASQPTPEGLVNARDKGVTLVINARPDAEMSFDERAVVQGLGLDYVSIPVTLETLGDEQVSAFIQRIRDLRALEGEADRVLVHDSSGNRVAALWAMYEIEDGQVPPEQAVARARKAGLKSPELVQFIGEWARRTGAW